MTILGALTITGDALVPEQHLCNFSVSDITCDKNVYEHLTLWTPLWPNANIVDGARCPLYWDPTNEHRSHADCRRKAFELQRRYMSTVALSDNATVIAQLVCWGPEEQVDPRPSIWWYDKKFSACYTTTKPTPRSSRAAIYMGLLCTGPLILFLLLVTLLFLLLVTFCPAFCNDDGSDVPPAGVA